MGGREGVKVVGKIGEGGFVWEGEVAEEGTIDDIVGRRGGQK